MHIRRPMVWLLAAYVLGIEIYRIPLKAAALIPGAVTVLFITILFIYRSCSTGNTFSWKNILPHRFLQTNNLEQKDFGKWREYLFLFLLPILIILGHVMMNRQLRLPAVDPVMGSKEEAVVTGRLEEVEERENYTRLTLAGNSIFLKGRGKEYSCRRLIVYNTQDTSFKIGNLLTVRGKLIKFQRASNPGQFDEFQYYKMRNIDYKLYSDGITVADAGYSRFLHSLYSLKMKLEAVYKKVLPKKDAGILSAMILGEMSQLDEDTKELYQDSGISHILSISGLNVSLLGITLFTLLRRIGMPYLPSTFLSAFVLFSYGLLTNFSVSTNRAVVMLAVLMAGGLVGRTYDVLSATALSAFLILLQSPLQLYNAGFLLSFGAILGIVLLYPAFLKLMPKRNKLLDIILLNVGIQLVTLPIILYFFFEFPVYSLLVNLLILPLSSLLVLMAVLAGITGCFFLLPASFLMGCVHYTLCFYEAICRLAGRLPGRLFLSGRPEPVAVLVYYSTLLLFIFLNTKGKQSKSPLLLLFLLLIFVPPQSDTFNITFLDVGQGDGIFMKVPKGSTYLIDGGSSDVSMLGKYRLGPFLKSKGIWEVDYAMLTHMDYDHISGVKELLETMEDSREKGKGIGGLYEGRIVIRHLVLPDIADKEKNYGELTALARSKGVEVLYIKKGDRIKEQGVTMTCLHPPSGFSGEDANEYSAVFSVNYGSFDLLLTGDLEGEGEELVLKEFREFMQKQEAGRESPPVDYDMLKVAHHGSKYSTSAEFLKMIKPEYAIISCGRENSYGHPHKELLERLKQCGSKILITKDQGAVMVETDGERIFIQK